MLKRAMSAFVIEGDAAGYVYIVDTRSGDIHDIGRDDGISYSGLEDFLKAIELEIAEQKMGELNYEKLKELVSKLPDGEYRYDGEEGIRAEKGSSLNPFAVTYRPEIGNAYAALNKELLMGLIEKAQKYDILNP